MGPFKAAGAVFNTIGTMVGTVDNTVSRSSNLIDKGFDALDMAIHGGLEDLATDNIVEDAERRVRRAEAQKKADEIIAKLGTTTEEP